MKHICCQAKEFGKVVLGFYFFLLAISLQRSFRTNHWRRMRGSCFSYSAHHTSRYIFMTLMYIRNLSFYTIVSGCLLICCTLAFFSASCSDFPPFHKACVRAVCMGSSSSPDTLLTDQVMSSQAAMQLNAFFFFGGGCLV